MYNFFAAESARQGNTFRITGADLNHMKNVLRMRTGEEFLVSAGGVSFLCRLTGYADDAAEAEILTENYQNTSLPIRICLFQGLPKSDKLELIIQKAVELGAEEIVPVTMHRCIVKLDDKKKSAKRERWQAIAEAAAKQSKRNAIPAVSEPVPFNRAMEMAAQMDLFLVPYENERGMAATKEALDSLKPGMSVGILIGPEGGFEQKEVEAAQAAGGVPVSLGRRILRTETAAITAVGMCMLAAELLTPDEGGDAL